MEQPTFVKSDQFSPLWAKMNRYIEWRIAALVQYLESDLTEIQTATVRGQIKELRTLKQSVEESPHFDRDTATRAPATLAGI